MRVLVTAGPTREPLDPVRFLSNRSSGRMGYALAQAALDAGHEAILISGPTALTPPAAARFVGITTSDELYDEVHAHAPECDVVVMCAAVSDYKPAAPSPRKLEKRDAPFALQLTPTRDILFSLGQQKHSCLLVGFAAQTHDLEANARRKLVAKNCDVIVANDVSRSDIGMESEDNEVTIFFRDGESKTISRAPKAIMAREILKIVFALREKSLTKKT